MRSLPILITCLLGTIPRTIAQGEAPIEGPPTSSVPVEGVPTESTGVAEPPVQETPVQETPVQEAPPQQTNDVPPPQVQCFAPDGSPANASYAPCNRLGITQSGIFSSCCRLEGELEYRELCAATGLCINQGVVRRESCTDPNWNSPACVDVCINEQWGGSVNGSIELTPCTDGTFCCGHNNLTCCGTEWSVSVPTLATMQDPETITQIASASPPIAAYAGMGTVILLILLLSLGVIYWLLRQIKFLKKKNEELLAAHRPSDSGSDESSNRHSHRVSYLPGSSVATTAAGSAHVPSMQEFAQFKAMYGAMVASNTVSEMGEHQRISELDGLDGRLVAAGAPQGNNLREIVYSEPPGEPPPKSPYRTTTA